MSATGFNLKNDFKPTPLCPNGTYTGSITDVKFSEDYSTMIFTVTLNGNGGLMSDNETPVDGSSYDYRLFLPKEGDEDKMTGSGKQTKWQWKVNQLGAFFAKNFPDLDISTFEDMERGIAERSFYGADVSVEIKIEEYNGAVFSKAQSITVTR